MKTVEDIEKFVDTLFNYDSSSSLTLEDKLVLINNELNILKGMLEMGRQKIINKE